jgi:hypothetical protein
MRGHSCTTEWSSGRRVGFGWGLVYTRFIYEDSEDAVQISGKDDS